MRLKHLLASTVFGFSSVLAPAVCAQTLPPERYNIDAHGVDLVRKQWTPVSAQLAIGGANGLSYGRVLLDAEWWESTNNGMSNFGAVSRVTVGGVTEVFDAGPSGWVSRDINGSTLTQVGVTQVYIYQRGGMIYRLEPLAADVPPGPFSYFLTQTVAPNGLQTDYTYLIESYVNPETPKHTVVTVARLQPTRTMPDTRSTSTSPRTTSMPPMSESGKPLKR